MNRFKGIFRDTGLFFKLLQLLIVTLLLTIIFLGIGQIIVGNDMTKISNLKTLQFFQSMGMFVLPPLLLAYLWDFKPLRFLSAEKKPKISYLLITALLVWVASPGINLLGEWNNKIHLPAFLSEIELAMRMMEDKAEILTQKLLKADDMSGLFLNISLIAIMPALGEEFFFRALLQKILTDKLGKHSAVWVAAIVFSAIHFQFYGFIPRMLMGAAFGYLLLWTGNIWYPVMAHFVNNVTAVVYFYLKEKNITLIDAENIGTGETLYLGITSLILTLLILTFIQKNYRIR